MKVTITHIDTACVLLNINGYKILTDPTLNKKDAFFPQYVSSPLAFSKKYIDPAQTTKEIGKVDLVLLSHDHHSDNLDENRRAFIKTVDTVLSTEDAVMWLNNTNTSQLASPITFTKSDNCSLNIRQGKSYNKNIGWRNRNTL